MADDRLVRFQCTLEGFAGPVVVDVSDPGPQSVEIPTGASVAEAADLPAT